MDFAFRLTDNLLLSTVTLVLGFYVLKLSPRAAANRLLFLICLWFVVRSTTALLASAVLREKDGVIALFRVNFFFYASIFSLNLHFFLRLRSKGRLPAWQLAIIYLPILALCAAVIADYRRVTDFVFREGEWRMRLPPRGRRLGAYATHAAVMAYLIATLAVAIGALVRSATNRERRQSAVLLCGLSAFFAAQAAQPFFPRALSPSILVYPMFAHIMGLCYATMRYSFLSPRPSPMTENLIAHVDDAVLLLDSGDLVSHANSAAERMLSAAPGSLIGRPFAELVRDGEAVGGRLELFKKGSDPSLRLRLALAPEGREPTTADCYLSKVKDRFSDLVGVLLLAKELPGRREFQGLHKITDREMEIVDLVLAGSSNKAIGEALYISERTVEAHCLHVYNKLGIGSKAELVKLCAKYDFLG
jgi:DNA-binding CsgD family transcriptional regulator